MMPLFKVFFLLILSLKVSASDQFKICIAGHIYKEFKSYGDSLENAVKMAIDENHSDVVYEKFYYDNSPLESIKIYNKMIIAKCRAIIGFPYLTDLLLLNNAVKIDPTVPILSPFAATFSKNLQKNFYLLHPPQDVLIDKLFDFVIKKFPDSINITILTDIRRVEMIEYKTALINKLKGTKFNVSILDIINDEINPNLKINTSNHLFFLFTGPVPASKFINITNSQGIYLGTETLGSKTTPSLINILGNKNLKNIYSIRNLSFDTKELNLSSFYKNYKNRFKSDPTILSIYGYDATNISLLLKSSIQKDFTGISGVKISHGKLIYSKYYSIISPSKNYNTIENGKL